ncbi:hypothetical protein FRB95_009078 [Tulasnella sp. JGI-2019a]|nr:hypothetical protein FRB95_009078 [Tulasnella sp. JGI-2019a]
MVYNMANRVVEKQRLYQGMSAPVYMRPPRSKLYIYSYYALFTAMSANMVLTSWHLVKGKPAAPA